MWHDQFHELSPWRHGFTAAWKSGGAAGATHVQISWISAWIPSEVTRHFLAKGNQQLLVPSTTVGSLWLENDLHENELDFESHMGRSKKKCPRYFRRDSHGNPRDLNMCRTGRSAALSRRRKSMPPIGVLMKRESMKLVVQQRKFTYKHSNMNESTLSLYSNFSMVDIFIYRKFV